MNDGFTRRDFLRAAGVLSAMTAFVTPQGVPQKYGRNRENRSERIIAALRKYLAAHHPIHAELRGAFVAV